ncbi:protein fantom-like [Vespula squamosa]|uniref:Protein fantom-like n=1 Tax=Vespula squamosa TaxID=30214 RepID=A0ABD2B8C2_VESSQ
MADDPNRDILPVKEESCIETYRCFIDPRERRLVCKLDRCQLEDKYLRLLEEANKLKKLSNCQEDKIKRLATKLMRVASNSRACVSLDFNDKNKLTALEVENSKLKNKLSVLKNQLLSYTMSGVSPTRSRRPHTRPSSGLITCRSENSRIRAPSCHCIVETHQLRSDDIEAQNYLVKIEELETQKKEMSSHITQLEKELESYVVNNQKEKVVENIEYIKVWRQMKQLSDKLMTAQNTNESLNLQINDLKKILEETTKNNQEITVCLMAEKKRIAGIDGQIIKAKDSQLTLREKDEQIRDLMNEMKILQQHNNELIALSSKYGQVELENVELKKKFTQQFADQQNFKIAFNTEQANIVALQTANEQLLMKLQYLQKNMDTLMVQQLAIIQKDNKKHESSTKEKSSNDCAKVKNTQTEEAYFSPKIMTSTIQKCKKCFDTFDKVLQLEKGVNTIWQDCKFLNKCVQTDCVPGSTSVNTKEAGISIMTSSDEPSSAKEYNMTVRHQEVNQEKNPLSREKMLKLLDQAQISMPLKAEKIGQSDLEAMQDFSQRHRQVVNLEKLLFGDSNC